jgi:hypothetical protein
MPVLVAFSGLDMECGARLRRRRLSPACTQATAVCAALGRGVAQASLLAGERARKVATAPPRTDLLLRLLLILGKFL